jgi:hypothetical protein
MNAALIVCWYPGTTLEESAARGWERVHDARCASAHARPGTLEPWPRRDITEAEARRAHLRRCGRNGCLGGGRYE